MDFCESFVTYKYTIDKLFDKRFQRKKNNNIFDAI